MTFEKKKKKGNRVFDQIFKLQTDPVYSFGKKKKKKREKKVKELHERYSIATFVILIVTINTNCYIDFYRLQLMQSLWCL